MNTIIFGPITSRRFGQSLGIDLSPNEKQCNFDCLYCELEGSKTVSIAKNTPTCKEVLDALKEALTLHHNVDVITLTANGEPTLYPELESLIDAINALKTGIKLLILSNGSTIANPQMQKILLNVDIVKLSLDCATLQCFKKLDRPHHSIDLTSIIEGMKDFRKQYTKELILEILIVEGINDKVDEFRALNRILHEIQPNRVDVGTIDRPPAYAVKGVSLDKVIALASELQGLHVNIAYKKEYAPLPRQFSKEEILALLERRPQSVEDVRHAFDTVSKTRLLELIHEEKVTQKSVAGVDFYRKMK